MAKKIIGILGTLLVIVFGVFIYFNIDSWIDVSLNKYIGNLLPENWYSEQDSKKYITTEDGELINTVIKYNHSNTSLFNDKDDLTFDQELLEFYDLIYHELSEINNATVSSEVKFYIAFVNGDKELFYLTTDCVFSNTDQIELEQVYIYVADQSGEVAKDLIKITKEKTYIYNSILYLTDLLYESSNDLASTKVVIDDELYALNLSKIEYYSIGSNEHKESISYDHKEDINRITSSLIADLFTIEYPNNDNPVSNGFAFNEENFTSLSKGVYPEFDGAFSQENPISQLLFDVIGEYENINVEHLGVTMNYVDTTTYSDIKLMLMFDLNTPFYYEDNLLDTTKPAIADDVLSLNLYYFVNEEWVRVKTSGTGDVLDMPSLENCIYGTTSSSLYDCYVFSDDSILNDYVLDIGTSYALLEHDLPGYLFDYIFEPIA